MINFIIQGSFPGGIPHKSVIKLSEANNYLIQCKSSFGQNNLLIQKTSSGNAFQIEPYKLNMNSSGCPLPNDVRQKMESVFNTEFSSVRIHTGGYQAESIGALAFTTGNDIYFAQGQYNPHTSYGQRILGHELTHVVQQRSGRVKNPFGNGIAVVNDHGLEAEAERMSLSSSTLLQRFSKTEKTNSFFNKNMPVVINPFWLKTNGTIEWVDDKFFSNSRFEKTGERKWYSWWKPRCCNRLLPVYKRIRGEQAESLVLYGREHFAKVVLQGNYTVRDNLYKELNKALVYYGFTVKKIFQPHDPIIVAPGNKDYKYSQIAGWAARQTDGGIAVARLFLQWCRGDATLEDLNEQLIAFALITHYAEVGRGYSSELANLYRWMEAIISSGSAEEASKLWLSYNSWFTPTLTYKQDLGMDWKE